MNNLISDDAAAPIVALSASRAEVLGALLQARHSDQPHAEYDTLFEIVRLCAEVDSELSGRILDYISYIYAGDVFSEDSH